MSSELQMVSIIVPVHNVEKYLEKCINSLIMQTYEKIEILLIDDGSTDSSGVICDECRDHRVRVLHLENEGVSNARNIGIKKAQGSLLVFVDSDDWVDVDYIETLVNGIEKYEADIYMCSYFDETKEKSEPISLLREQHYIFHNEKIYELINDNMLLEYRIHSKNSTTEVPWGKIYRKEYLERYRIFFPYGLKRMQDTVFNLYAFYHAKRIAYDNIPKYHYRRNTNSTIHRFTEDFDNTSVKILKEIRKFYELYFFNEKEKWESAYYTRAVFLLILYVKLFLGHEKCNLKFSQKVRRLEELSKRLCCEEASNKRIIEFNRKYRLIQWLIKRKQYGILYLVLHINMRVKQKKNELYE